MHADRSNSFSTHADRSNSVSLFNGVVSKEVLAGAEIPGGRGRGRLMYLTLHCNHQNDSCIKTGSDESRFNILLIVRIRGKVTGSRLLKREESRSGID